MKIEKVEKVVTNLHDKNEYVIYIGNLKQALNHGLILKNVHRLIKFNQKVCLKPYIDMNTKLRQKWKIILRKTFSSWWIMQFLKKLWKTMWEKNRNIKLVATETRRNYLVSEPNYHATKFFTENLLAIEMRKTQILMNNPVCLGLSILHLTKTVIYEFWYDSIKPKYAENENLCYMDTDSFIVHVKADDIYIW